MVVTESGITIAVNEVQYSKALRPMVVTESGITIAVNEVQRPKAHSPIFLTVTGSTTDVSNVQPLKALSGISVTPYGTMTAVQSFFFFIFFQYAASSARDAITGPDATVTLELGAESAPSTPDAVIARAVKRYEPGLQVTEHDGADVV